MHDHYISMNLSLTQNINAANSSFIIQTITHTGLTPVHVWAVLHVPATGGRPIALELLKILLHRTADPLALADNGDTLLHLLFVRPLPPLRYYICFATCSGNVS